MFVSIFKPATQPHRARFALNPAQMLSMFGHRLPIKGDRLDISAESGMVKLTANPKGRFALSNAHSARRPGFVTILASEVGMTKAAVSGVVVATKNGGKTVGGSIPLTMRTGIKTPAPKTAKPKAKRALKATAKKTAPKRIARKAATKKTATPSKMKALGSFVKPKKATTNRPTTTMLGDAVSRLNKILAVTKGTTVTTKNGQVLVTAERTVIVAYT